MGTLLIVASASAACAALVLACKRWHLRWTADTLDGQPQKIHSGDVPRVGGLCVLLALAIGVGLTESRLLPLLIVAAMPATLTGFAEDIGLRVAASVRLGVAFLSGGLFIWMTGEALFGVDLRPLDTMLQFAPVAIVFTMFCFAGIVHAMNIVDGVHGLSIGMTAMAAAALSAVCANVGLDELSVVSLLLSCAALGLLPFNFPFGRLFLGDGGAYLFGAMLAGLSIAAASQSEGVSAWFPLCLLAYPVIETLHSGIRRRAKAGGVRAAFEADNQHLHTLLHRAIRRSKKVSLQRLANPVSGAVVVFTSGLVMLLASMRPENTIFLVVLFMLCVTVYLVVFRQLVHLQHSQSNSAKNDPPEALNRSAKGSL